MKTSLAMKRLNRLQAKRIWNGITTNASRELDDLTDQYAIQVNSGDVLWLDNKWYITHAGLLRIAQRRRCSGIRTLLQKRFCDPAAARWIFKAVVYKSRASHGFVGYGDADPSNVSLQFRGSELRIAETRAVSRALRKAYGIGICSVEELRWTPKEVDASFPKQEPSAINGNGNGAHSPSSRRLRDRLCVLIRQHRLDPSLVKSYAADFCGTPTLSLADRERLEAFVSTLSQRAATDRDALVCHLNSYATPKEAQT